MPCALSSLVLCSELETVPWIQAFLRASASMKKATVEPVPTPTMLPSSTYSAALSPERRLPCSFAIVFLRHLQQRARVRRGDRLHRQARAPLQHAQSFEPILVFLQRGQRQHIPEFLLEAHVDHFPARLLARRLGVEVVRLPVELGGIGIGRARDL